MAETQSLLGDADIARAALRSILADPDAPAQAKASAARTLAEMAGALGKHVQPEGLDMAPFEMTRDELYAELHGVKGGKARKS